MRHALLLPSLLAACVCGEQSISPASDPSSMPENSPGVRRSGETQATMLRRFDGVPPDRVFQAITSPCDLQEWMTAAGRRLTRCEVDLRVGGKFRHEYSAPGRSTLVMHGEYLKVIRNQLTVHTEAYEGYDWSPLKVTTRVTGKGANTVLTLVIDYPTKEICDTDYPNLEHALGIYDALAAHLAKKTNR